MFVCTGREPESKGRLCCVLNGRGLGSAKSVGIIEPGLPLSGIFFMEENCENRARTQHRSNMGAVP
jgi:hypothetical protein